jgi:drug/metabolite transporter (DMT)-like permease
MSPEFQGHLAMLAFSALVAGSFSLGSLIAGDIAPVALTAARFWIAAAVIGALGLVRTGLPLAHFRAPWRFLILGGLFAIYFVLMFEGLKTAPPVNAAAVFTLIPAMAALFGWLLLRQVFTARIAVALALGAVGAVWVIFRGDLGAMAEMRIGRGEIVYFWGCIAHALYAPMVPRLNRGEPAVDFSFGMIVAGAILLTARGWPEIAATEWTALPGRVWIGLLYLAIFASAATFVLVQFAALRLPASKVMAYTYLTPSWVILWEIALGHGAPPALILIGVAMTAAALLILLKPATSPQAARLNPPDNTGR